MRIKSYLITLAALILLLVLVPACGGGGGDENTATPVKTPVVTATSTATTPTPAPTSREPVKIGVLTPWSGAAAMSGLFYIDPIIKVVEKQVKDMGGILGGRAVEFVKFDTVGQVALAAAGAKKLIMNDHVCALTIGGASGAEASAIADVAEEEKVFFASTIPIGDEVTTENEYMVVCSISMETVIDDATRIFVDVLKPRTIGVIIYDDPESRLLVNEWKKKIEAAGIELVYEEYIRSGVTDLSPYLTKMKYKNPDCLLVDLDSSQMIAMAKQIMDLGGWGDIQVASFANALSAAKVPGAEGWIVIAPWHPSKDDPESLKFKEDFKAVNGKSPDINHVYIYNTFWTAIHAIELAGSDDPAAIARAARSGDLEFDTPMGRAHFGTDGFSDLRQIYVQIQKGGTTVLFTQ